MHENCFHNSGANGFLMWIYKTLKFCWEKIRLNAKNKYKASQRRYYKYRYLVVWFKYWGANNFPKRQFTLMTLKSHWDKRKKCERFVFSIFAFFVMQSTHTYMYTPTYTKNIVSLLRRSKKGPFKIKFNVARLIKKLTNSL